MQTNCKKVLAVLLTLVLLCGLLPMGMLSVSAAEPNLSLNWNDGNQGFDGGSIVTGGPDGSNCFKWTASGGWSSTYVIVKNMDPANDYVITMKAKSSVGGNMGITIQNGDWGSYWNAATFKTTTSWTDVSIEIPANSVPFTKGGILFKFQDVGVAMDLYVDDLVIAVKEEPAPEEPETPTAGENLVVNGSFENGNEGWKIGTGGSIVSGGYTGNAFQMSNPSAWAETGYQEVSVEAHETYTLTWRSKRVSGSGVFNMNISKAPFDKTTPTITAITNQMWMNSTSTEWIEHKASIKMTDANGNGISKIMVKLTCEAANAGTILIDDIVLTKNLTASFDGYLYNGDFEVGSIDNWTAYHDSVASTAAKKNGAYGVHMKGNGSWGGIMHQTAVNVVAGKTYVISYWIKVVANGMNLQIIDGTSTSGRDILGRKTFSSTCDWTLVELEVTPQQNGFIINFCGIGSDGNANSAKAESAYVDDITVTLKGGNPEEKVEYTGSSVRDEAAGEGEDQTGKGLAFQFKIANEGGTKGYDNKYQNNGKIVLGDQKYDLVRMGAVMTNNATIGQNAANFNLTKVDGKKVIDIPAVYLNGATEEYLSFAVRILDIPDRHIGTAIYARPYYVYKENNEEVIVYGDTRSNNYAKAANISTADKTKPIKILSIGHSFSKDVMTTNLYNMFIEGGYTDVTIGYLYMAGCSMPKHLYNIQNNLAQYEYAKNNSGRWVTKNYTAPLTALKEEEWDFVTVQSSPDYIGGQSISSFSLGINNDGTKVTLSNPQTEYEAMDQITDWIKANATNANVKIDYHMIWSFSQGCDLWSGMYHKDPNTGKYSQMVMYNNITTITQDKVQNHEDINRIIPSATAIQNARSSFMGDTFNMPDATQGGSDGYHLNDYGDYVAALTWYCHYSGDNAQIMAGYLGNGEVLNLTAEEFQAIAEAVNNAIDIPFAVTESTHK